MHGDRVRVQSSTHRGESPISNRSFSFPDLRLAGSDDFNGGFLESVRPVLVRFWRTKRQAFFAVIDGWSNQRGLH